MNLWNGAGVALITPMNDGGVDYEVMEQLINFQIDNGTDALIIAGTTGESATLSKEEKLKMFKFTMDVVEGRVPVIAGTGSNNTADSIALSKAAEEIGVDGLLLVTPYYNKPSQRGLYAHFAAIANSVKIPIILYNVPGRTSVDLLPETVIELAKIDNIMALKEASGHPERCSQILPNVKDGFKVYSGNDNEIYDFMVNGGHGVISVLSNVAPEGTHNIVESYLNGDHTASENAQKYYDKLVAALFMETNPVPTKEALNMMGYMVGDLRLPLVGLTDEHRAELESVLTEYGLISGD
ncbi:MAG: 4-hydroxy-tetrahydrodipicolinate synthase [Clostridiaceae bacterium]